MIQLKSQICDVNVWRTHADYLEIESQQSILDRNWFSLVWFGYEIGSIDGLLVKIEVQNAFDFNWLGVDDHRNGWFEFGFNLDS